MSKAGKSNPFIVVSPCNGNENLINNASLICIGYSRKTVMAILGVKSETVSNPTGDTDLSAGELGEFCVDYQMKA